MTKMISAKYTIYKKRKKEEKEETRLCLSLGQGLMSKDLLNVWPYTA